jgi:hypothetical protein
LHTSRITNPAKGIVDEERAEIVHVKALQMKADGLTKPYDEGKHKPFAKNLLGEV